MDKAHEQALLRCQKPVLFHLCQEFGLRQAQTALLMAKELIQFVPEAALQELPKKKRTKNEPPSEQEMIKARSKLENAQSTIAVRTGVRVSTLLQLCAELGISTDNHLRPGRPLHKGGLLDRLANWRLLQGLTNEDGNLLHPERRKQSEMEMTFINDACRAANLPALLSSNRLPDAMTSLWPEFQKTFHSDIRGTRLNDTLSFGSAGRLKVTYPSSKPRGKLAELQSRLAKDVTKLTGIHHSVNYGKRERCTNHTPGRHGTPTPLFETLTFIRHLLAFWLSSVKQDPYQQFGFSVAGGLFFDQYHPLEIIKSEALVTLFARTVFEYRTLGSVVHVLPIIKDMYVTNDSGAGMENGEEDTLT
ncbi:hypothetical protein BD769DRAFT_1396214 [Suillus cothurnatus]|nr:hypothetical protein BD769DRAFT_1396214 [Suillus cothurnatus]